ncbi:hypothetical protein NDU88_006839 [Pleurodeles waltl]|uniref:Uncharacterized protein n=1 Tax=Pleurodeles waltl TaxID=8319 RepID=A0AAV7UM77_PLEWA|nr:hypothetical protein NDU88_006839 [Pleurodeles waltl]
MLHWLTLDPMGPRSQWRCTLVVTVRTAADVTAIFYHFNHSIPDLRQERTYTASAAVTSVSAHQKKDIWRAIAKDVRTLGVYHRRSTHCQKRCDDIRCWSKKMAEAQLGMASQRGSGACRTMTPLMFRILAVAYPELDGRLKALQQTQGASSGGGAVAMDHEGAASHMALDGDTTESEFTSGTEGEGSSTAGT